jgi:hypothetical protein
MRRYATADESLAWRPSFRAPAASFVAGANWYVDGGSTEHVFF